MDCTVVVQAGNCLWGIGLGEELARAHTHAYIHRYLPSRAIRFGDIVVLYLVIPA
jgi:hypothetical protein